MIIGFSFGFFLCSEVLKMFKISSYMNIPEMHNILYIRQVFLKYKFTRMPIAFLF